ncbi:unnamed protein product [Clonostachys solani]|uniref:NACHT domain-containing protein n=1 Tax=Clonostachys solani TaxID=160281 RepID=A0A9N9WBQ6_9HYPO|nr:unnamed protein product [Clonostachys solani]
MSALRQLHRLATSVVQVIDFSSRLLSGSYQIYHSVDGHIDDDRELKERATVLRKLASTLTGRTSSTAVDRTSKPVDGLAVERAPASIDLDGSAHIADPLAGPQAETNAAQDGDTSSRYHEMGRTDTEFTGLGPDDEAMPVGSNNALGVEQACRKLQKLRSRMQSTAAAFVPEDTQRSEQEKGMQAVAAGCSEMAKKIETTLQKMRADPKNQKFRTLVSFRQAFLRTWSEKKINEMEKALDKRRSDLILHLVVVMSDQQSSVVRELRTLRDASNRLGSAYTEHLDGITKSFKLIQDQAGKESDIRRKNPSAYYQETNDKDGNDGKTFNLFNLHIIPQNSSKKKKSPEQSDIVSYDESAQDLRYLAEALSLLTATASKVAIAQRVLAGLHYKTMMMRMESVAEAYANTYEWIFKTPRARAKKNIKVYFSEWLLKKDGIFWVSGKPGSGKSTLMKFLCDHVRTEEALVEWAKPLDPVMSTHFFWSSGTAMQKSQEGLFKSLLYDVFRKSPEIMKAVCPQRWEAGRRGEGDLGPWTLSELRRTLISLATCSGLPFKFCFFIDGLDEYEGDHPEMITVLRSLATCPNIKLCVSSRPWNVFEDAFGNTDTGKLYLQHLTNNDIRLYVRKKLEEHPNWQVLPEEQDIYRSIVTEVTTKAQGVFLWVYLVIRSLYEGLTNGDSLPALERRIRRLPADLEPYFKHMLNSVDSFYHAQMVQTFQVAMASSSPLPLMIYCFLDEEYEQYNFGLHMPVKQMPIPEVERRQAQLRRRLNGRCKGLLEVYKNAGEGKYLGYRVDFLHRTVRDFLRTKEMSEFLKAGPTDDGPNALIFKGFVPLIKSMPWEEMEMSSGGPLSIILMDAMHYAYKAEQESGKPQTELLEDLSRALRFYATTTGKPIPWYRGCYSMPNRERGYRPCQTFLEFAVQNGLCLYVKEQLGQKREPLDVKQPLPLCAVAHLPRYTIEEPDLSDMIRLLLDTRMLATSHSIDDLWNTFMTTFAYVVEHADSFPNISDMVKHRQGITELLLARGANPNTLSHGSIPAWYRLLATCASRSIPPSVYQPMLQSLKLVLSASVSFSGRGWSVSDALHYIVFDDFNEGVEDNAARLEFVTEICCLMIPHGFELTSSQRRKLERRFPARLVASIFSTIDEQNSKVETQAQPKYTDYLGIWSLVSWMRGGG